MSTRTIEREQFLADVITTAIEGGTGYWARVYAYRWDGLPPAECFAVIAEDEEEAADAIREAAANFTTNEGRKPNALELIEYGTTIDGKPVLHKLDIDTIAKGIGEILKPEFSIHGYLRTQVQVGSHESDGGHIDADGADAIVQAALFGKLVYG